MSHCDGHHADQQAQRMLMITLTKLLDTHHLATAVFDIDELEQECDNRSLIMAIDDTSGRVYFRVCDRADYDEQVKMMMHTIEEGMQP